MSRRHLIVLSLLGIIVGLVIVASIAYKSVGSRPVVAPVDDLFDAGLIDPNETPVIEHEFQIKNYTGNPIILAGVRTSCSCTTVSVDRVVPPHSLSRIKVKIDLHEASIGLKKSTIIVYFIDSSLAPIMLSAQAIITPQKLIEPQSIDFGDIQMGDEKRVKLRVYTRNFEDPIAKLSVPMSDTISVESIGQYSNVLEDKGKSDVYKIYEYYVCVKPSSKSTSGFASFPNSLHFTLGSGVDLAIPISYNLVAP
jgi:hypothetical protein